ncbi:MAG: efflux RND transporter periplasmic adaptor subunit [Bacteroidota bacterium]
MNKRKTIISIAGAAILVIGIMVSRVLSGSEKEPPTNDTEVVQSVVNTQAIENGPVKSTIEVTGRVIAAEKIDLFAEVTGVSTYGVRPFKTGNTFRASEILLKIDDGEFTRSLASAKSQFSSLLAQVLPDLKLDYPEVYPEWKNYLLSFDITKAISALPEVKNEQLKFFLTGRNVYPTYYNILESEERLDKYIIRAPFSGTLTESNINQGTLVRTGQQLGEFIKNGTFELEASITYSQLDAVKPGMTINFADVKGTAKFEGKLTRINNKVDPATQLVNVYFVLNNMALKSGLYLKGDIETTTFENATVLPIQSLVDESYVLTVENGKAKKVQVKVLNQNAESFIVSGLSNGSKVIIDKKNSAFEGTAVIEM